MVSYFDRAAGQAIKEGFDGRVLLSFGDCSPSSCLPASDLEILRTNSHHIEIEYEFYDANLGYGGGNNRLLPKSNSHYILILNPDVMVEPFLLVHMFAKLGEENVGFVEARQLPIEHPKYYDPKTGDTGWGSCACAMMERGTFEKIGAFDHETFFMYGDDVDISWRMRLAGKRVVMEPKAIAYHDKKLKNDGSWDPSPAEIRFSAECALYLPYKYSRQDVCDRVLKQFKAIPKQPYIDVCKDFDERLRTNRLPQQIDPDNAVAEFVDGNYTRHRC